MLRNLSGRREEAGALRPPVWGRRQCSLHIPGRSSLCSFAGREDTRTAGPWATCHGRVVGKEDWTETRATYHQPTEKCYKAGRQECRISKEGAYNLRFAVSRSQGDGSLGKSGGRGDRSCLVRGWCRRNVACGYKLHCCPPLPLLTIL